MTEMILRDMIRGTVTFKFYRDDTLYYETENGITFPVPIHDVKGATFLAQDKGIYFMRWIRRFIEECNSEKAKSYPNVATLDREVPPENA